MKKQITIYDVAKKASVSLATVSRVINNSQVVKEKTRERVQQAIDELNFVPSAVAQGLALKKSTNIALVVPEASFSFISQVINGVVDVVHTFDYKLTLHSTNYGKVKDEEILNAIIKSRVDGVIILNSELTTEVLNQLAKHNIPVTVVGTPIHGNLRTSVYIDYDQAVYNVVKPFLDKGIKNIAFIDGDYNRFITEEMLLGLKRAYKEQGMKFTGHVKVSDSYTESYDQIKDYLINNNVELCLAARDSLAIAALNAALDSKISIPEQLEIIGFNNTKYSRMSRPALSTVHVPLYELGAMAARHMTKMLNEEEVEQPNHQLETYLVERMTTKK